MMDLEKLPVVVIGAGPVGLAAAAHLTERGVTFVLLEAGPGPAASVREWKHVRLFTPWRYNIDTAARRLLAPTGWQEPDGDTLPTGRQLLTDYLAPLAALPDIAASLRLDSRVEAISRVGYDRIRTPGRESAPFRVRIVNRSGTTSEIAARAVVDASGTWRTPNHLGADGLPAYGERPGVRHLVTGLPDVLGVDRDRFAGRHTIVVGAGHSATTTLLALGELRTSSPATAVTWAIRGPSPTRAYGDTTDELPARGAIGARLRDLVEADAVQLVTDFFTHRLETSPTGIEVTGRNPDGVERHLVGDLVVNATGFRPDHHLAAELRLTLDSTLGCPRAIAPLIDPNEHFCGSVPAHGVDQLAHDEVGYYIAGVKSYGRAPTFLLATGYEQVRSVVAALAGDWAAARDLSRSPTAPGLASICAPAQPARAAQASPCAGPPQTPDAAETPTSARVTRA
ncbi:FAD-dependent oxidoreductase [Plantactinospora endophytica]|uniref:Flavoprotein n=1 Tax=Plantactinospora endophytica TaxID=673535 RepID=A0ABQ4E7H0_9ACTN|nr:FAD-dependent oxidoreductase [Plantactinospora endophytica]GIG90657.1 flavoprotein [Plantactinospora endophytica]